jgi:hypothetical protein
MKYSHSKPKLLEDVAEKTEELLGLLDMLIPKIDSLIAFESARTGGDVYDGPHIDLVMAGLRQALYQASASIEIEPRSALCWKTTAQEAEGDAMLLNVLMKEESGLLKRVWDAKSKAEKERDKARQRVEQLEQRYAFHENQRLCVAYNGCDGDLEGTEHEIDCPARKLDEKLRPHLYTDSESSV